MGGLIIKVGLGITSRCNMSCAFCYSKNMRNSLVDLSPELVERFIQYNAHFIEDINYGTSENVLSPFFENIVKTVSMFGIDQAITTNGSIALKDDWIKVVAENMKEVDVSLDFPDQRHDSLRGLKGAYKLVMRTLEKLSGQVKLTLVTVLLRENTKPRVLSKLMELAEDFDCLSRFNLYVPRGINDEFTPDIRQLYEGLREVLKDSKVVSVSEPVIASLIGLEPEQYLGKSVRISADGHVFPLVYVTRPDQILGNIKEGFQLSQVPHHPIVCNLIKAPIPKECSSCIYVNTCKGGCVDRRIAVSNISKRDIFCPFSFYKENPLELHITLGNGKTIHSSYLPTIIVKK